MVLNTSTVNFGKRVALLFDYVDDRGQICGFEPALFFRQVPCFITSADF